MAFLCRSAFLCKAQRATCVNRHAEECKDMTRKRRYLISGAILAACVGIALGTSGDAAAASWRNEGEF